MTLNLSRAFLLAAAICLAIALLIAVKVISGNLAAWEIGGLFSFVLAFVFSGATAP